MKILATTILSLVLTVPALTGCSAPEEPAADAQPAEAEGAAGGSDKKSGSDSK